MWLLSEVKYKKINQVRSGKLVAMYMPCMYCGTQQLHFKTVPAYEISLLCTFSVGIRFLKTKFPNANVIEI